MTEYEWLTGKHECLQQENAWIWMIYYEYLKNLKERMMTDAMFDTHYYEYGKIWIRFHTGNTK